LDDIEYYRCVQNVSTLLGYRLVQVLRVPVLKQYIVSRNVKSDTSSKKEGNENTTWNICSTPMLLRTAFSIHSYYRPSSKT
jgi:hypothetical protein